MNWKRCIALLALLVCFGITLTGCSSSEEKAAKQQLGEALALEEQHDLPAARTLLGALQKQYPQTEAAAEALAAEQRIVRQMDQVQRQLSKTLESLVLVIAGYQSMTGRSLASLDDLDSGDYMFGSSYLAEAIPEGVKVFLLLNGKSGFRLWAYQEVYRMGMHRDNIRRHGLPFSGDEAIAKLRNDFASQQVTPRLTLLKQPASDAH